MPRDLSTRLCKAGRFSVVLVAQGCLDRGVRRPVRGLRGHPAVRGVPVGAASVPFRSAE